MRTESIKNDPLLSDVTCGSKTATIQIRVTGAEMAMLNAASERLGISKSALLREHGLAAAQKALEEEKTLSWSDEAYEALVHYLNGPARPNAEMVEIMSKQPIWELT